MNERARKAAARELEQNADRLVKAVLEFQEAYGSSESVGEPQAAPNSLRRLRGCALDAKAATQALVDELENPEGPRASTTGRGARHNRDEQSRARYHR